MQKFFACKFFFKWEQAFLLEEIVGDNCFFKWKQTFFVEEILGERNYASNGINNMGCQVSF